MYLHALGSCLVILSCTGIGLYFGSSGKDRLEKLRLIRQHFTILRSDIRCGSTLPEALETMYQRSEGKEEFPELMAFYGELSDSFQNHKGGSLQTLWEAAAQNLQGTTLLPEDLRLFSALGGQFGYLDCEMQLKTVDLYLSRLEEQIEEQAQKAGETMRLCRTLGLLAGIFIVVVML